MSALCFRVLQRHEAASLQALLALYASALPVHEQKPSAELVSMFGRPGYVFLVAEQAGQLAGFAILYALSTARPVLLEYLAVSASLRGNGVGASLFALSALCAGERPLLVEMDAPRDEESRQRDRFYRRQGCVRVEPLVYILPLPGSSPPPMWLLTTQCSAPSREELERWLCALYTEVYQCADTDPRIAQMLADGADA